MAVEVLKATQGKVFLVVQKGALQEIGIMPEGMLIQPEEQVDGKQAFPLDVVEVEVSYVRLNHPDAFT